MKYNEPKKCKLVRVIDGDTLDVQVLPEEQTYRVRMNTIDAPELSQPAGWESRKALHKMLEDQDFTFYLVPKGTGRYGKGIEKRIIADLYTNATSASLEDNSDSIGFKMCQQGYAWHYNPILSIPTAITNAQERARSSHIGMWNRKQEPVHPKHWRKNKHQMSALQKIEEYRAKKAFMLSNNITKKELENVYPTMTELDQANRKKKNITPNKKNHVTADDIIRNTQNSVHKMSVDEATPSSIQKRIQNRTAEANKFNSYAPKKVMSDEERKKKAANFEATKELLKSNSVKERIKSKNNLLSSELAKVYEQETEKKERKEERIKILTSEETKASINKVLTEKNEEMLKITANNFSNTSSQNNMETSVPKQTASEIQKSNEEIDAIFNVDDLNFDLDDIEMSNSFTTSDEEYSSQEVNYDSNDSGFQNKVSQEQEKQDTPIMDNYEDIPPMDNQEDMPPMDGYDMPPMDNYEDMPPIDGYDMPPMDNYEDMPPMDNYEDMPPMDNYEDMPPMDNYDLPQDNYDNIDLSDLGMEDEITPEEPKKKPSNTRQKSTRTNGRR